MNNGKLKFPILSKKNTLAYFIEASEAKNKSYTILILLLLLLRRYNTEHNSTQNNDTEHNGLNCDTQHNVPLIVMLIFVILRVKMPNVIRSRVVMLSVIILT